MTINTDVIFYIAIMVFWASALVFIVSIGAVAYNTLRKGKTNDQG